jgi:hypothetical protein
VSALDLRTRAAVARVNGVALNDAAEVLSAEELRQRA